MARKFFDLEAEESQRIAAAEADQHDRMVIKELTATREAVQSLCALMMGVMVRQ